MKFNVFHALESEAHPALVQNQEEYMYRSWNSLFKKWLLNTKPKNSLTPQIRIGSRILLGFLYTPCLRHVILSSRSPMPRLPYTPNPNWLQNSSRNPIHAMFETCDSEFEIANKHMIAVVFVVLFFWPLRHGLGDSSNQFT